MVDRISPFAPPPAAPPKKEGRISPFAPPPPAPTTSASVAPTSKKVTSGGRLPRDTRQGLGEADFQRALIIDAFHDFSGQGPTQEELAQLLPTAGGEGGFERGRAAVSDFVAAQSDLAEQQSREEVAGRNLEQFLTQQRERQVAFEQEAGTLFEQQRQLLSTAPQLFGNLSEDQISQFLAPLEQAFAKSGARTEGVFARRGISGSSSEANALAEQTRLFKEQVVSTGLLIGQQQQQQQVNVLGNRIGQLFGGAGQSVGQLGQGRLALSAQENRELIEQQNFLRSLPFLLRASAQQELAALEAQGGGGFGAGDIGTVAGTVIGGVAGLPFGPVGVAAGATIGGTVGGFSGRAFEGEGGAGTLPASTAALLPFLRQRRPPGGITASQPLALEQNQLSGSQLA